MPNPNPNPNPNLTLLFKKKANGLKGIPAMPFLHYHASQLGVNTVGFLLFGIIIIIVIIMLCYGAPSTHPSAP
jgi:hypothetical protein